MAKVLYALGGWAFRRRKTAVAAALAVLVAALLLGLGMGSSFSGDTRIPGTKSELAQKVLADAFRSDSNSDAQAGGTIQLIYKAPENETLVSESVLQIVKEIQTAVAKDEQVASITGYEEAGTLSLDKRIGYTTVTYKTAASEVTEGSIEYVKQCIELAKAKGLQTELGGSVELSKLEVGGVSEAVGIVIAFFILAYTFRSFRGAGLPIISAVIGLGIGIMGIFVASHYFDLLTFTLSLAAMLGLSVGIDYGLFIISRFQQNLQDGHREEEAVSLANATAGSAVVFAGVTVIIAVVGLTLTGIPFLGMMGLAAAFTVFVAVLVSLVCIPAMLGFTGGKLIPKERDSKSRNIPTADDESNWWGRIITKYPLPILIVSVLALGLISLPAMHMHTGLPDNGSKSTEKTERRGYDLLAEGFGPGFNGPLIIVAKAESVSDKAAAIAEATKGLAQLDNVASVSPPIMNPAGDVAFLTLLPGSGPQDKATTDLVKLIREQAEDIEQQEHVKLMVTGMTAVNIDITDMLNQALPKFAAFIIGLAIILLTVVFRSILIPIKAVLGYLLTLTATLGFIVFVVQDGHLSSWFGFPQAGPVLNFLPVLVSGILFGLAMDYEVFLVSRMREKYAHSGNPRQAILYGLKTSGSVVMAAGFIMIAVFGSFVFAEDTIIKSMGLALAFGVLFDAFVVRLTIVPALMSLLGRSAWYVPKWLDRIMPKIDVEGESIHTKKEKEYLITGQKSFE